MCTVENCTDEIYARSFCVKHYRAWLRFGDPQAYKPYYGSLRERFFRYVIAGSLPDECWKWTAAKNKQGYGKIGLGGKGSKIEGAHRVSWELHNNQQIPDGMFVLHSCDNPECTNPKHLRVGTKSDNMKEMYDRARQGRRSLPIGESNNKAVLTYEKVVYIRKSTKTNADLAEELKVSKTCVRLARVGETWKHVPMDVKLT
jgi:hypothetical protein